MSFQTYLENLRSRPEHIRKRYSVFVSLGLTIVIFAFWLQSFSFFSGSSGEVVTKAVKKTGTPAQSLVAGVGSFINDIREIVFGSKKVIYTTVEVKPGRR